MKTRLLFAVFALLTLTLMLNSRAHAQERTTYDIHVSSDGSADWLIEQTGTNLNSSVETLIEFQTRVSSLVDDAMVQTGRNMSSPNDAMSITSTSSGSYVTVEYRFSWINFSNVGNRSIVIGDVFGVPDLFGHFSGDGEVQLVYPSGYFVEVAIPQPKQQNQSLNTLIWPGTMDFASGGVNIVLSETDSSATTDILNQNALLIASAIVGIGLGSSLIYFYVRRRKKRTGVFQSGLPVGLGIQSDVDVIENLLRSSGGTMYQSAIVEECRFSKAKTSQLLSELESHGRVSRQKRGRDKIVILVNKEQPK